MRKMMAITILTCGLAASCMGQSYSSRTQGPQSTQTQDTAEKKDQKEASGKFDCKAGKQSRAKKKNTCPDCEKAQETQSPEQAPQNVVEYGG